tara:strand:+ start:262 stop:435 length:174 start_codon:yes stop_codon:yes gene_type:complete
MKLLPENKITRRDFTILLYSTILVSCVSGVEADTADSGAPYCSGSCGSGSYGSGSCE